MFYKEACSAQCAGETLSSVDSDRGKTMKRQATAILPMRGGSQRVTDKNTRLVANKPLYTYIIDTLRACKCIERIVINTDIEFIFAEYGWDSDIVLIRRGQDLTGNCDMNWVIAETLEKSAGEHFLQVHATNPLVKSSTIDAAISRYFEELPLHDSCFSVNRVQKRFWDENARPINHSLIDAPTTQDLRPMFEENSCFYIFSRSSFKAAKNRIGLRPSMAEIPASEAWDIDTEEELKICEAILESETREDSKT